MFYWSPTQRKLLQSGSRNQCSVRSRIIGGGERGTRKSVRKKWLAPLPPSPITPAAQAKTSEEIIDEFSARVTPVLSQFPTNYPWVLKIKSLHGIPSTNSKTGATLRALTSRDIFPGQKILNWIQKSETRP